MRRWLTLLSILPLISSAASAEPEANSKDPIIVTGNRLEEAEISADLAKAITLRPPTNTPLPKHYEPVCIKVFGLDTEYADVLATQMRSNMRALDLQLAGDGCAPTIWVGFVRDSHAEVTRLRKNARWIFGDLRDYEIDRALAGSKASQAWFAREDTGTGGIHQKDGLISIGGDGPGEGIEVRVKVNNAWSDSRIAGTIRVDMIGSIVLFDSKLSAGRTIRQLADYATIRALAPVKDLSNDVSDPITILTLFAKDETPPTGLTEFDWAYLSGYYKLGEHAGVSSVHDAARSAFLDGLGDASSKKSGLPVGD
jgi:hypothetical protein